MEHVSCRMASWLMAHGSWLMAHGLWLMAYGLWLISIGMGMGMGMGHDHGARSMVHRPCFAHHAALSRRPSNRWATTDSARPGPTLMPPPVCIQTPVTRGETLSTLNGRST